MKISTSILALCASSTTAFTPSPTFGVRSITSLKGYLDDLNKDLYAEDATPDVVADSREANTMDKEQVDRYGPGNLSDFVEFEEFDGGDGQMGVAGDGSKGLDKSDFETGSLASQMNKSRMRSAKNAWGTDSGYANQLREQGMDTARAQQLENWNNQQELKKKKDQMKYMTEQFDQVQSNADEDWRQLAKFGVERNQDFDMNEEFGEVKADVAVEGTLELSARPGTMAGGIGFAEVSLKNEYMGFADFRAAFTSDSATAFSVDPAEGSLSKEPTTFQIRFRPDGMGVFEGYLVIETEDFKKTWKCIGTTG